MSTRSPQTAVTKSAVISVFLASLMVSVSIARQAVDALPANLQDGLVLHYAFDTDRGRAVTDLSSHGNHGRVHSGTYVATGRIGRAMSFDGEADYVEISPDPSTWTEVFTFSAWIKTSDRRGRWQSIISFEAMSYAVSVLPNGHVHYGWQAVKRGGEGTTDVRSGQWVFVAVTRDAEDRARIYVNGEMENSLTCDFRSLFLYSGKLGGEARGTEYFHGTIDEVRLYQRALSGEEVRMLYTRTAASAAAKNQGQQGRAQEVRLDPDPSEVRVEIGGVVRDKQGTPLSDVHVVLRPKSGEEHVTDSEGRFSGHYFMHLGPSSAAHAYVFARHPERDLAAAVLLPVGEARQMEIELHEAVTITGRICDPAHQPIPGSRIGAILCDDRWGQHIRPDWPGLQDAVTVDDNGVFAVRTLPHGCYYELEFWAPGYAMGSVELGTWDIRQRSIGLGDVVLPRANRHLAGRVVDKLMQPVPHATVTLKGPDQPRGGSTSCKADGQGKLHFEGLGPGAIELQAFTKDEDARLVLFGELVASVDSGTVTIVVEKWLAQCGLSGPGPWSLRGKPLPDPGRLAPRPDGTSLGNRKVFMGFWQQDSQESRHFMQRLIHVAPDLQRQGFAVQAVRVPGKEDELARRSLAVREIPFPHGTLASADECMATWGFSPRWLPWVIITDRTGVVTTEGFGLHVLRKLARTE